MKILTREQFLRLQGGVLYTKYEPCDLGDLEVKWDSLGCSDWVAQPIVGAFEAHDSGEFCRILDEAQETGCSIPVDFDCAGRDGCFDRDQLFLVWERGDVAKLADLLQGLLAKDYPEIRHERA